MDRGASPVARLGGLLQIVHPFPSFLDAAAVAAIAAIAGGGPARIAGLAVAMLLLQFAIGAANDWADATADAVARPDKPIPAGLVPRRAAAGVATLAAAIGLTLAASCGPLVLALAAAGLVTGLAYDFRLKGTAWSWAPYAVGIPLLPVFAWVGSAGSVPAAFAVLVPVATLAGAALAIANAAADLERDRLGGTRTVATSLGPIGARRVGAALQGVVVAATLGTAVVMEGAVAGIALAAGGAALVGVGVGLGWHRQPSARSWEVQAIGLVALAAGWVASLAAAGRLAG